VAAERRRGEEARHVPEGGQAAAAAASAAAAEAVAAVRGGRTARSCPSRPVNRRPKKKTAEKWRKLTHRVQAQDAGVQLLVLVRFHDGAFLRRRKVLNQASSLEARCNQESTRFRR